MTRKWVATTTPANSQNALYRRTLNSRDNLLTAFDKIFDETFKGTYPEVYKVFGIDPFSKSAYPKVNVISFNDRVEIEAEIAGYSRDDISVEVEDETLTISGRTSTTTEPEEDSTYLIRELKRSSFSRSFKLSDQLDGDEIDAAFDNGLLKLVIPRKTAVPETRVNKVVIK
jgi:HSP20 family protein